MYKKKKPRPKEFRRRSTASRSISVGEFYSSHPAKNYPLRNVSIVLCVFPGGRFDDILCCVLTSESYDPSLPTFWVVGPSCCDLPFFFQVRHLSGVLWKECVGTCLCKTLFSPKKTKENPDMNVHFLNIFISKQCLNTQKKIIHSFNHSPLLM